MEGRDIMKRIAIIAVLTSSLWSPRIHAHEGAPHVMGTVAAVDANHIVVQTTEGKTLSIWIDANTTFRQGDKAAAAADLKAGDRIVAEVSHKGETLTASEIRLAPPAENKRASGQEEHPHH
jgi:Domain of unknown function (DUF5666)